MASATSSDAAMNSSAKCHGCMGASVPLGTWRAASLEGVIAVVGSVNLDLVARLPRLPAPGETLAATSFSRVPGGKGANQALAARRLGADVRLAAAVGSDDLAGEALSLVRADGVDTDAVRVVEGATTGLALIEVDAAGETTIVAVPGANARLTISPSDVAGADAVLTVFEVPDPAISAAAVHAPPQAFFALNAAPARPVPDVVLHRADLIVVNSAEYGEIAGLRRARFVAVTHGAGGAVLLRGGRQVASARAVDVDVVDATAAGDAFCAALVIAMCAGADDESALHAGCAAGGLTVSRHGAQTSLPTVAELNRMLAR
jgi:ribokinase